MTEGPSCVAPGQHRSQTMLVQVLSPPSPPSPPPLLPAAGGCTPWPLEGLGGRGPQQGGGSAQARRPWPRQHLDNDGKPAAGRRCARASPVGMGWDGWRMQQRAETRRTAALESWGGAVEGIGHRGGKALQAGLAGALSQRPGAPSPCSTAELLSDFKCWLQGPVALGLQFHEAVLVQSLPAGHTARDSGSWRVFS